MAYYCFVFDTTTTPVASVKAHASLDRVAEAVKSTYARFPPPSKVMYVNHALPLCNWRHETRAPPSGSRAGGTVASCRI
ncbi:hypothetical protein M407DRAFT_241354 [Tulasnella calospora MUT 4182]|uniref:Uncharacterized protein n=1 Tax=Tulasnella calospora MUT 4182 TaxID=1051891 RepID=A0A0C3QJW8_9AGAM|nr:hypothetical protein M407DRAFT_241354 [Tulasnella calospora MUT 4182]